MTACAENDLLMHGLLDGELDAANAAQCEAHIAACADCAARFAQLRELQQCLRATPRFAPAPGLRARIARALAAQEHRAFPDLFAGAWNAQWLRAPAFALAAALAVFLLVPRGPDLSDQLVASHVRSLQASHLYDIASSDRHTVKPWFTGRLDYSPPVADLASEGFTLVGGRLDYLDGRNVAVIVYRRNLHTINLYAWPRSTPASPAQEIARAGYNIERWAAGGMNFWAISDLSRSELRNFRRTLAEHLQAG